MAHPLLTLVSRIRRRVLRELANLRSLNLRHSALASGRYVFIDRGVVVVNRNRIRFGNSVVLQSGVRLSCDMAGELSIGDDVHVSVGTVIACGPGKLHIGDHTIIGEYTSIRNTNHGTAAGELIRVQPQVCLPIWVGSDVWIGRGCAILPGVTVGDGAVVGANSVVTRDVAPQAIVAGAPARTIGRRDERASGPVTTV